jgi:hypothetical protein
MERAVYITEEEHGKCQKVAKAFAELYEIEDVPYSQGLKTL